MMISAIESSKSKPVQNKGAAGYFQAPLFRQTGVMGKDIVRQMRQFFLLMLITLLVYFIIWMATSLMSSQENRVRDLQDTTAGFYLIMLSISAYVFGLSISFDETESGTTRLLSTLPVRPRRHLFHKLTAGLLLLLSWVCVAGLLLGSLSGQGTDLLGKLFSGSASLISTGPYGRSLGVTMLQATAILMTGLVAGHLFRNIAACALCGALMLPAYLMLAGGFTSLPNRTDDSYNTWNLVVLGSWCLLQVLVYALAWKRSEQLVYNQSMASRAGSTVARALSQWPGFRTRPRVLDFPHAYILRTPFLMFSVILACSGFYAGYFRGTLTGAVPVLALLAFSSMGSLGWLREERESSKFLMYTLPVDRSAIFWTRMRSVLLQAGYLALIVCVTTGAGMSLKDPPSVFYFKLSSIAPIILVGMGTIMVALVAASLGTLFRLFHSVAIVPLILAVVITGTWCALTTHCFGFALHGGMLHKEILLQIMLWSSWTFSWAMLFSLGIAYIAFCRSRLLELPDRRRGTLSLILVFFLLIWGSWIMSASPIHLWDMITR